MVKAQLFGILEQACEAGPVPSSLPPLPAAAVPSTIVPAGETSSAPCLHPEEPAQEVKPTCSVSSGRTEHQPDIPISSTAPGAAPSDPLPAQEALDPAVVMAGLLRAAAEAAIAAGAFPPEEPKPDYSSEEFDTPYSMSRRELRSMRNTLELGIARMALMTRTPATDVQVRCAIAYLRCHDAPAGNIAALRLPQLVAQLRSHPTPAIANQSRALLADRGGCFREAIRVVMQTSPKEAWLFADTLSEEEDSGGRSGLKPARAKKGVKRKGRSMAAAEPQQAPRQLDHRAAAAEAALQRLPLLPECPGAGGDMLQLEEGSCPAPDLAAAQHWPQEDPAPAPDAPNPTQPPPPPYKCVEPPLSEQPAAATPATKVASAAEHVQLAGWPRPLLPKAEPRAPAAPEGHPERGPRARAAPAPLEPLENPKRGRRPTVGWDQQGGAQRHGAAVPKRARHYSPAAQPERAPARKLSRLGELAALLPTQVVHPAEAGMPPDASPARHHAPEGSDSGAGAQGVDDASASGLDLEVTMVEAAAAEEEQRAHAPPRKRRRSGGPGEPVAGLFAAHAVHPAEEGTLPQTSPSWQDPREDSDCGAGAQGVDDASAGGLDLEVTMVEAAVAEEEQRAPFAGTPAAELPAPHAVHPGEAGAPPETSPAQQHALQGADEAQGDDARAGSGGLEVALMEAAAEQEQEQQRGRTLTLKPARGRRQLRSAGVRIRGAGALGEPRRRGRGGTRGRAGCGAGAAIAEEACLAPGEGLASAAGEPVIAAEGPGAGWQPRQQQEQELEQEQGRAGDGSPDVSSAQDDPITQWEFLTLPVTRRMPSDAELLANAHLWRPPYRMGSAFRPPSAPKELFPDDAPPPAPAQEPLQRARSFTDFWDSMAVGQQRWDAKCSDTASWKQAAVAAGR